MKTALPKVRTVYIKIQEFYDGKYKDSASFTVYDTTAKTVKQVVEKAIERGANGK